ncbi:hypothetical protein [Solemya velum gill symbiont]|uniref:Uncharacterized protein n=1 Tax=Solemya velum gill symbiont TaxID=2340 RepID=A0A0B0H2K8_SOVGS|nr:hypothetical protein [Solemya velum gill symbiont]KHF24438.1 hypothetical protein JV46_28220 [Solemya velum gill symbiont]OOY34929.1 hypothetical protein BOV88_07360 [Solemya velum gill symbiont]OOY37318.1 hypothetical protein BOV89_07965 [Solemya velum gill symbiont]OOY40298.1 hypothetical protein BOV90_04775 [Solemya velum gill symbiont]OOY41532.1 hypothetical protein BOV91_10995 [Solemya velum gill symbiont]
MRTLLLSIFISFSTCAYALDEDDKNRSLLQWYQGEWQQVNAAGESFYGGCVGRREIANIHAFPNLKYNSTYNGVLLIKASEAKPDHLFFSSALPYINAHYDTSGIQLLVPVKTKSNAVKVPLSIEESGNYMRIHLASEIPGMPYKRYIDFENNQLKFVAYGSPGTENERPYYFSRCP